jgi:hypothetical protein
MSASYVYGHAPLPGFALLNFELTTDPPVIRVTRTAYDHHVVGFDFSTAIGDLFGLRGEAAYRHPLDYEDFIHAPNPDLQYVLGVDSEFGEVSVIAQYSGRYVFDWAELPEPTEDIDLAQLATIPEPLPNFIVQQVTGTIDMELALRNQLLHTQSKEVQHSASLRVEWRTLHDTLSLSVFGMANFSTKEWLVYPRIGYSITDGMILTVGGEIYVGPNGTLLDMIDERMSAGYTELKILF